MKKENVHDKHRERLRDRYLNEGIDGLRDHEVLELILFYAIPRKDTNELAHKLLNKFGNLSGVLIISGFVFYCFIFSFLAASSGLWILVP